jgi:hypothetical protein
LVDGLGMVGLRTGFAAIVALLIAIAVFPAAAQPPASNPRIALVVGEQTYRDEALATTANDAGLIAQTLQAAGFDVVGARDLDGQGLRTALRDFPPAPTCRPSSISPAAAFSTTALCRRFHAHEIAVVYYASIGANHSNVAENVVDWRGAHRLRDAPVSSVPVFATASR